MHVERLIESAVRDRGGTVGRFHSLLHLAVARWQPNKTVPTARPDCDDPSVPIVTVPLSSERVRARVIEERQGGPLQPPARWSAD